MHALSEVLDELESSAHGEAISVQEVVEKLGPKSFASVMLVFSLISASPASAIPGITAVVGITVFLLAGQMILGRDSLWLPHFIASRRLATAKLCKGISWLRKPVHFIELFMKERLTFLLHRPWIFLPLALILLLSLFMPFMEVIPTSGTIASAIIAVFAAGLLTRDGAFVALALLLLAGAPFAIWYFGLR